MWLMIYAGDVGSVALVYNDQQGQAHLWTGDCSLRATT